MMTKVFSYNVSGAAATLYPTVTFFALLELPDDDVLEMQKEHPFRKGWGVPQSIHLYEREAFPMPQSIDMVFLSVVEKTFYSIIAKLHYQRLSSIWEQKCPMSKRPLFETIVVGMAPYGGVALWAHGRNKATILKWMYGEEVQVKISDFAPFQQNARLSDICNTYINADFRVRENLEKNGLPPRDLFDNYMKQFTYRYQTEFGHWDEEHQKWEPFSEEDKEQMPEFDYIEESLFDGTHDKLHDGGLMNYHPAGKPKKIAVKWHVKNSEFTAYFWFEDEAIREVFDRFYGAHPDTKTDFMIRIDAEKNKYELALYRYGLKEPQVINESVYQLIVFKNKFECFRSKNYDQPRGAWIW